MRIPRYTAVERRAWKGELELDAITALIEHLRALGDEVAILEDRPEHTSGGLPDVDFELSYNGKAVGVEVTQLIPAARSHYEISSLQRHIQEELGHLPAENQLGLIVVAIRFGPLPNRAGMDADVATVTEEIRSRLEHWPGDTVGEVDVSIPSGNGTIREVRLIRRAEQEARLAFITSSSDWGGAIRPMAEEFLENLVNGKPAQTGRWEEAWILVHDRVGLVSWDDLVEVLPDFEDRLPTNWRRIYVLPAADGVPVVDLLDPPAAEEQT